MVVSVSVSERSSGSIVEVDGSLVIPKYTYIIYTRFLYYFLLCLCKSLKELFLLASARF